MHCKHGEHSLRSLYPAAAEEEIVVVGDAGLAGSDGALGAVELECRGAVGTRENCCRGAGMVVADFDGGGEVVGRGVEGDPVAAFDGEGVAFELGVVADDDAVVGGIEFDDVERFGRGDAEAFALADGVEFDAVVPPQDAAMDVHDVAGVFLDEFGLLEEAAIVFVGHEADFHALFFVGGLEMAFAGDFAGVALGHVAEREEGAGELFLFEREEEVALVFARVFAFLEEEAVGTLFDAGKVAGGNVLGAKLSGAADECAEFEFFVAHDARVGRAASFVFFGEVVDDLLLEIFGFVDQVIGDAEFVGDGAGIHDGLRAAAFVFGARDAILGPEFEGDADDVVALFEQKGGGSGGIDASAQANNNAGFFGLRHGGCKVTGDGGSVKPDASEQ